MENRLKKLEQKIRELCPELMKKTVGCKVIKFEHCKQCSSEEGVIIDDTNESVIHYYKYPNNPIYVDKDMYEVIGHPISLEACRTAFDRLALKILSDDSWLKLNQLWKNFQTWEKQTKVHQLLYEIFNIK